MSLLGEKRATLFFSPITSSPLFAFILVPIEIPTEFHDLLDWIKIFHWTGELKRVLLDSNSIKSINLGTYEHTSTILIPDVLSLLNCFERGEEVVGERRLEMEEEERRERRDWNGLISIHIHLSISLSHLPSLLGYSHFTYFLMFLFFLFNLFLFRSCR